MTSKQTNQLFHCGECKHHICVQTDMRKIICSVTLEFKDKANAASCEYADRLDADDRARLIKR